MPASRSDQVSQREQARRRRVELGVGNFAFFGEYYVRPYDENWIAPLPELALEFLGFAKAVRRGVLMTPPEFLKTTVVSQLYPLALTYRYAAAGKLALLSGMLLSEEQDLAERNLAVVAWHIQHNPRLREDFVDVHGRPLVEPDPDEDKWTDDAIVVRRPGVSKDPTWSAKGIRSKGIQGKRLRHLIGDDVVTPASANSPAVQKEAKRLWDEQITTRVLADGQAIIAGNFNHPHDLLSELAGRPAYSTIIRPALHVAGDKGTAPKNPRDPDAVPALPEKWPRSRLLRELADKPGRFERIYLLRTGDASGSLLKAHWVTRITLEDIPRLERVYLLAIDGAPGAETDPDPSFFNITVGCLTPEHLDVVESYVARCETPEQIDTLAMMVARYQRLGHVGGIGIAKIALDRYFKGAALTAHPELRPLLHEHSITSGRDNVSKIERLAYLGNYFRGGWARVVETAWTSQTSGPDDRDAEETLAEQWAALPNQRHDDRLDGLDILLREAQDRGGVGAGQQAAVVTGSAPGTPTGPVDGIRGKTW